MTEPIVLTLGKNQRIVIPVKVKSVNGQVGDVVLTAPDVGAVSLADVGDGDVLVSVALSYNGDTVTIEKTVQNVKTGNSRILQETVELATTETAGAMSPASVAAIQTHTSQIAALQGQTVRLLYTASTAPTAEEIAAFVTAEGYTEDLQNVAVVVSQTFHIWHWYSNTEAWQDDGVDTVSQFTNAVPGVILGSQTPGQIYAEDDGTGSVVGWDDLVDQVENVVAEAKNYAENAEESANDAADDAQAASGYAEEAEAWAVGTVNGSPVASDADQFDNNAKYYAKQAGDSATDARASAAQSAAAQYAAFPLKTVSGNPAVITDGADGLPVKALSVEVPAGAETVTVQTLNENIFRDDVANWQNGYFYNNAGQKEANSVYACTDGYFPVVPNAVYTAQMVKGTSATTSFGIIFYDADKNFLSRAFPIPGAAAGARAGVFTSVPNAYFIRINVPYSVSAPTTNIQILKGDHGTTYNPATDIVQPTTIASYAIPAGFAGGVLDVTNGTLTETGGTPQTVEAHDLDTDLGYNCILVNTGTVTVNYRRDPSLVADFLESYLLAVEQRLSAAIVAAGN